MSRDISNKALTGVLLALKPDHEVRELGRTPGETESAQMMIFTVDGVRYLAQCREYPKEQA